MKLKTEFLFKEKRKFIYIALLLLIQLNITPIQDYLMTIHINNTAIDIIYVLAISMIPSIIYMIIFGILFSFLISFIKMNILPTHTLEKKYFGFNNKKYKKIILYGLMLVLLLYGIPYLNLNEQLIKINLSNPASQNITDFKDIAYYILRTLVIIPLYILSPLKTASILAGALFCIFIIHILSVRTLQNKVNAYRTCSTKLSKEKSEITITSNISSSIPILSHIYITPEYKKDGIISKKNIQNKTDLLGLNKTIITKYKLKKGFYSADIFNIYVITPPFISKVCIVGTNDTALTVIPKTNEISNSNTAPILIDNKGNIITKKIMGSSYDFAGINTYNPGDPLNRIWWLSLAKSDNLMTKSFNGTGEDSIVIMPELYNHAEKKYDSTLPTMLNNIVTICSKKNIFISIHPICKYNTHSDTTKNKKKLLFYLMNLNTMNILSPKGAENIFKSGLSKKDYNQLKNRCIKNKISLSSIYGASGFQKRKTAVFSWERKKVFEKSTYEFFKHQKKRSKIILITNQDTNITALENFKKKCLIRKFRYIIIILGKENQKKIKKINDLKKRHIIAYSITYENAQKMSKIYTILGGKIL